MSLVIGCCVPLANAGVIPVGLFTLDDNAPAATFNITNLTGANAFPPDFPITTQLTITVTSLVAALQGGGTLTISGSNFSVVDPEGDLNCAIPGDAASGGCDLAAYNLVSATLMGTLSPLTGLAGLPAGINEIQSSFTATMTPNAGCGTGTTLSPGCDAAVINAATVPEPATWTLLGIVSIGLLAGYKFRLFGFSRRAKI